MSRTSKFDYQAAIERSLLLWPEGLTLDELLERSELEVDRSTLFRHLSRMIQGRRAERTGKARATRYRLLDAIPAKPETRLPDTAPSTTPPASERLKNNEQSAAPAAAGDPEAPRAEPDAMPAAPRANSSVTPESAPPPALPAAVPATPQAPPAFTAAPPPPSAQAARLALETSRHGPLVVKAVRRVVRERRRFNPVNLDIYLSLLVPREELDEFSAVVRKELAGLSADNLHRFDLSPAEFSGYTPLEELSETPYS